MNHAILMLILELHWGMGFIQRLFKTNHAHFKSANEVLYCAHSKLSSRAIFNDNSRGKKNWVHTCNFSYTHWISHRGTLFCKSNIALLTFLSVIAVQPVTSYNFSFLHLSVISVSPELVASLHDDRFKYSSSVRLWTSERIPASVILQLDNRLSLFRPMRCRPIWCNPKSVIFRQFERSGTFRLLRFRAICSMPSSPTF